MIKKILFIYIICSPLLLFSQHNPGANCLVCHSSFKIAGTVFTDSAAKNIAASIPVTLYRSDGSSVMNYSNHNGNLSSENIVNGDYIIQVGGFQSRSWHKIPDQGSCNTCHINNITSTGKVKFPSEHTRIPEGNDCSHCHHFPQTKQYSNLVPSGVLNNSIRNIALPESKVFILNQSFSFDPKDYTITTLRPDIFASGFFSMFDVIINVAAKNGIPIEYYWDDARKTHFITKVNGVAGDYWYGFSFDTGSTNGNNNESNYSRANRWDELLWRSGAWVRLKINSSSGLDEIKAEYLEEINREKLYGHMIPSVQIQLNPKDYKGNPPGSGRITVSKTFSNVLITPHNARGSNVSSIYPQPFQPGVVTSFDIPLSLKDQGKLTAAAGVYYTRFAGNFIESFYLVEMGFPAEGTAHASGRNGFIYTTENGTLNKLPNGADSKLHMTSDINVIHAPDFSSWRWLELGNPYYEANPPSSVEENLILEDYESIPRGFNLHPPYPNPFNGSVIISYNIFQPGQINISVYDILGRKVDELKDGLEPNIGVHKIYWEPKNNSSGVYLVRMRFNKNIQTRQIAYLR
ncbi:MAG: hypothetical protein CVV24_12785 [Ignavibacteriae bacterium HGW-Ignavibacteriae-3]|nr:MAG: hypothetical protein CVV24_12785 [Ignavibacteriae bacterium HGW-Ignavibacteriae-3]